MMLKDTRYAAALPPLVIGADDNHWLEGFRCRHCQVVVADQRIACPACGNRAEQERLRLGTTGTVHTWTMVHRSYGNAKTPFLSVVVDLDGGGSLKGTLLDFGASDLPKRGLRVRVVFRDTGQIDSEGRAFLCYFFVVDQGETP